MDPSQRTCYSRVAVSTAVIIPAPVKNACHKVLSFSPSYEKISEFSSAYIFPQAKNYVKAKVLPLSKPPGWNEKKKNNEKEIRRLKVLLAQTSRHLEELEGTKNLKHSNHAAIPAKQFFLGS